MSNRTGANVTLTLLNHYKPANMQHIRWLLLSFSITFALHAFNLNNWVPACFVVCAIWRYLIEKHSWPFPKLWLRLPMIIIGGFSVYATYGSLFGRDASVALFAVMIALKLLETKTKRDFIVMVILGYFLTVNVLLFTQAIWVFFIMLLPIFGLTVCLIAVSHPNGNLSWKMHASLAGKLLLQAAPIMLVLFVLFPRIPGPIWSIPEDAYSSMTGLSDSMEPGNISQLSLSSKVAFRAEFKGAIPANNQLYWRGPVLWQQKGRRWEMTSDKLVLPAESFKTYGAETNYTITLEPHNRNWLLMLDIPTSLPPDATLKHDMQVLSKEPIRNRIRYEGRSSLHYQLGTTLSEQERTLSLQLTEGENPKTRQLSAKWLNDKKPPAELIQAALTMFKEQPFVYTLAPPLLGNAPIDDFLFNTKRGFCEHYASSFVYLMRAAGVPARIVTGYQGGELNPNGNYLIIRQSDAHAWAEVWLASRGWVRIDPTSAVSPERIESGIGVALTDSYLLPLLARNDYPLLKKINLNWDALNNGWNQWVLGYDQQKQLDLLSKIMQQKIAWEDIGLILIAVMTGLMLIVSYFLLHTSSIALDPVRKTYQQFLAKLKKAGLIKQSHEGAMTFGERAAESLPEQANNIQTISSLFSSIQYAKYENNNTKNKAAINLLKQLVRNFKIKSTKAEK